MSFFTPEKMFVVLLFGYSIVYGIRLQFIQDVMKKNKAGEVFLEYYVKRSFLKRGSSFLLLFVHLFYYLFLLFFPILCLLPFFEHFESMGLAFCFCMFYSAEIFIERLFFLLEKHVKYEMIMFGIINDVSDILWNKNDFPSDADDKVLCAKTEIPWRHQTFDGVQKVLDDLYQKVRNTPWR